MAGLAPPDLPPLPSARSQLAAIVWLRWRMYLNGLRRLNSGAIVARIFVWLLMAWGLLVLTVLPIVGAGFAGYFIVAKNHPHGLFLLLWALFLFSQFITLNAFAASAQQFDENALIRFPLPLRRFLALKLVGSLFTIGFPLACALMLSIALGIGLANSALFLPAACALALFLAFSTLLSRSLQIWINRWLSTRRSREIFSALFALFFISMQLLRLRVVQQQTKLLATHAHGAFAFLFTGPWHMLFAVLPPSLAAEAVFSPTLGLKLASFAALLVFVALTFALYAWRVRKQFFGEFFSDTPAPKSAKRKSGPLPVAATRATGAVSPLRACLSKEWTVQRRNSALFIQQLMPLIFVVIFSANGQLLSRHPSYALPGAIGYSMLAALSAGFNLFGAEAAGIQFYLVAPIRIRDVVAAKHIVIAGLALLQGLLAAAAVLLMGHAAASLPVILGTALWAIFVILVNFSVGAFRSLAHPTKIDANKVSLSRRNAAGSRSGGYLALGLLFGSLLLCYPVFALTRHFGQIWLVVPIFALLAAAAIAAYAWMLSRIDSSFLRQRETLVEVLTKSTV